MAGNEDEALEERLKAALWLSVGKIVDEEMLKLGLNATPQFIGALTEMLWAQIGGLRQDPLPFIIGGKADHGVKRTQAKISRALLKDVLLLARRNEGLETILRKCLDQQPSAKSKAPKKR
ncbi:MAG: hypothetical protein LQ345_003796 [Seirophora villosa]|nr:MAG: hypothetical protein LQ345_003796 [Seirophora villosa]